MSLINQLLADLEKRHASGPEMKALSPQVRALPGRRPARRWPLLVLVGAAISAAAFVWFAFDRSGLPAGLTAPVAAVAVPEQETALPTEEQDVQAALLVPVFQLAHELSAIPETPPPGDVASPAEPSSPAVTPPAREPAQSAKPRPAAKPKPPAPSVSTSSSATASAEEGSPKEVEEVVIPTQTAVMPIEKQMREPTAFERAENEFRKGAARLQQGRVLDAETHFRAALQEDRSHAPSRQALIGLLVDAGRNADAEQVLRDALQANPRQARHAMLLARLELERGDAAAAVWTLEASRPYAGADPQYFAFLAVALQRAARHEEAVTHFRAALSAAPANAIWLMGLGISLRAINETDAAKEAFLRAAASQTLSTELQTYVESQARDLAPRKP